MQITKINKKLQTILESLDDLNDSANRIKNGYVRDNYNRPNTEGKIYKSRGGNSYNYNKVLQDAIAYVREKDEILADALQEYVSQIKKSYIIKRNTSKDTYICKSNDGRVLKYTEPKEMEE